MLYTENDEPSGDLGTIRKEEIRPKKGVAFISHESNAVFVDTYGKNQGQLCIVIWHWGCGLPTGLFFLSTDIPLQSMGALHPLFLARPFLGEMDLARGVSVTVRMGFKCKRLFLSVDSKEEELYLVKVEWRPSHTVSSHHHTLFHTVGVGTRVPTQRHPLEPQGNFRTAPVFLVFHQELISCELWVDNDQSPFSNLLV